MQGYEKAYARYTKLISSPEEGEFARTIEAKWTAYQQSDKAMLDAAMSGANQGEAHAIAVGRPADDFVRPSGTRASSR
ncbi:hypothetical protein [Paraburkholderia sp. JHI869]|uniref:hypothetical protein n=1 Tax=Paraburkholderia sp. JHI869 TaxID=3112959 RepID=UPI00317300E6